MSQPESATDVQIGQPAPEVTLPRDGGSILTLSALRPKAVVLYFYPRDDTSGCTTEAKDFTGLAAEFDQAGAVVIGISKDSVAKHDKFITKHELGIALLSDAESDVCERFGVWGEKKMYGKTFMGIERATFLIDGSGTIRQVWRKVKVKDHAQVVLDAVKSL